MNQSSSGGTRKHSKRSRSSPLPVKQAKSESGPGQPRPKSSPEPDLNPRGTEMSLPQPEGPRDEAQAQSRPRFANYLETDVNRLQYRANDVDARPSERAKVATFIQKGFGVSEPHLPKTESIQRGSQTDWYLTDAPKLEHGLRRTFNPESTYRRLDRARTRTSVSISTVQEVRIKMVDIKDKVDPRKLLFALRFVVICAILLLASGAAFFLHLVAVTVGKDSAKYLGSYLENNFGTMLMMFSGIFHPVIVGLYCLYAGRHLHSVRPFYWRAAVTLIIPIIIFVLCLNIMLYINRNLEPDFHKWLIKYPDTTESHKMWDTAQTSLRCCGLKGASDWKLLNKTVPDSCCIEVVNCDITHWWHRGCLSLLQDDLNLVVGVYIGIVSCQIIFQVMAVIGMRMFYLMIRDFFPTEPTVFQILIGPCSIVSDACLSCFPGRTTRYELEETQTTHELEHDLLPRDKHGDLQFKAPFPWTS